jgi:hypothetical protein
MARGGRQIRRRDPHGRLSIAFALALAHCHGLTLVRRRYRVDLLSSTDGADLPASQASERPARQTVSVGETYDFEFEPEAAAELRLEIFRPARAASPQSQI